MCSVIQRQEDQQVHAQQVDEHDTVRHSDQSDNDRKREGVSEVFRYLRPVCVDTHAEVVLSTMRSATESSWIFRCRSC